MFERTLETLKENRKGFKESLFVLREREYLKGIPESWKESGKVYRNSENTSRILKSFKRIEKTLKESGKVLKKTEKLKGIRFSLQVFLEDSMQ